MSHYMQANRSGWCSQRGWYKKRWKCCKCGKTIKTVFKGLDGKDYCIKCFNSNKPKEV